jgi:prophage DNA circulation protein
VYDLRSRYAPTMVQARFFTVPETMALWQVARLVYGDASLTTLLRAANAISDPLAVAAGTVLTILPAPITAT